ncbi:hypothetical protein M434DRAFT_35602 [Hypoxylon sp. CO27-5]|nr:hypothetical protein M434DRAFT_35602 [Hypoxylon sp. CO27-5]
MPRVPKTLVRVADLGKFEMIPQEVIGMILDKLDVHTAARFAKVNRKAKLLMLSNKHYRHLSHCLFTHLEIRRIFELSDPSNFLKHITPRLLSSDMLHPKCVICQQSKRTYRVHVELGRIMCQSHKLDPNITQFIELRSVEAALRHVEKYEVALDPFSGEVKEYTEKQLQRLLLRVEKNAQLSA